MNSITKIIVGSANPVKISAVRTAFLKFFPNISVKGIKTHSGVSSQPQAEETFTGAKNRAENARKLEKADYYVGIEGGMIKLADKWFGFGCMHIIDKYDRSSTGLSPFFPLPHKVVKKLLKGQELGKVIDELTGEHNTKHKQGAIGFFTNNVMSRKDLYVQGMIAGMGPFLKKELFK